MKIWSLFVVTALLVLGGLFNILFLLPPEDSQGFVQKIFFIHVPSAFAMYASLIIGTIFAVLYLIEKNNDYDRWSQSFVKVSFVFALSVMITGPIWAKPIWGVYWTWDPRLTTMLLISLMLAGYISARRVLEQNPQKKEAAKVVGAIIAIAATLDIPLIHFSVKLWRGIHPSVLKSSDGLPPSYRFALSWMVLAFILLSIVMSGIYYKYLKNKDELNLHLQEKNHA